MLKIKQITNLYKHTNVKIAFKCNNKISQLMKPNTTNNTPYYNKSGIYKLTCNTCKLAYIGQTSRSLKLRFQEHIRFIWQNNPQSAYAQHILQNRHEYGPIERLMTILKPLRDTTLPNTLCTILHTNPIPKRTANPRTKPGRKEPPSPTCHWSHPHTTYRNQSNSYLHTIHIVQSSSAQKPCLPHQQVHTFQYAYFTY
jgi:hypothetical protein